jgi:hypothetical protein
MVCVECWCTVGVVVVVVGVDMMADVFVVVDSVVH